jgi:hypothetical protein
VSLLDNGPDTVQVFPEETVVDGRGNPVSQPKATGPVTVAGVFMQPVTSQRALRDLDEGQRLDVDYRLIGRSVPAGPWSAVTWQGRRFVPTGAPLGRDFSPGTGHVTVYLREER